MNSAATVMVGSRGKQHLASFIMAVAMAGSLGPLSAHAQASSPASAAPAAAPASAAAAPAPAAKADAAPAKPDIAKGQAIATQVCAACHAVDGSRGVPAYPILQGQHPEYLVKQLTEFKSGVRDNPIMKGMASALSEADMRNVAAFYASKQAKASFSKNQELATLGEKIYRGGIAEKSVPACAGCHSPTGAGLPVKYPRIGGQFADYTEAQLVAFRSGARHNGPMMMDIASRMSDKEIKAVADYVTGLQRLAAAAPAP